MTMTNKPRWIAHNQPNMPARLKPDTLVNVAFKSMVCDTYDKDKGDT